MRLTRRQLMAGAAAGALAGAGIYELVDQLAGSPARTGETVALPPEQHLLQSLEVIEDNGVEVLVPPLHHQLVTAKLRSDGSAKSLRDARAALEEALAGLDGRYSPSPAGLGVTVAWGLPYFRRYVPRLAREYLPVDRRASAAKGRTVRTVIDAIRFPSDPHDAILEANEVAVLLRSDDLAHIRDGAKALFQDLDVFRLTSIRRGFVGGGFRGGAGLPKRLANAAGVRGADLIPDGAELFLGFTSTQRAALGPTRIANVETLGYSDGGRDGYFRAGTHMHVSHMTEDLEKWYINFAYPERVATTFRPGLDVADGTKTIAQRPRDVATSAQVKRDYSRLGTIGHSQAIQTSSRLQRAVRGADGTLYPKGTAIPQRADFNTLDNPFAWTSQAERDAFSPEPAAGLHFVVFNPTSDDFHRNRLAMDGVLPDGTRLKFEPGDRGQGLNSVLQVTHRQNFIVPPRRNRSFPLVELIADRRRSSG